MLRPDELTITSFLRPRKWRFPLLSNSAKSPVESQSEFCCLSLPPSQTAFEIVSPRTSTSPSLLNCTSRPGNTCPIVPRFIMHLGWNQRWDPQAHKLTEDVTERQCMQKSQRVHEPLVLQILVHLAFDRP